MCWEAHAVAPNQCSSEDNYTVVYHGNNNVLEVESIMGKNRKLEWEGST